MPGASLMRKLARGPALNSTVVVPVAVIETVPVTVVVVSSVLLVNTAVATPSVVVVVYGEAGRKPVLVVNVIVVPSSTG